MTLSRLGNLLPYLSLPKDGPRKTGFMQPGPYSKIVIHVLSDVDLVLYVTWSNRPNDHEGALFEAYDIPRFVNGGVPALLVFPILAEFAEIEVEFLAPEGNIFSLTSFGVVL